jgi:hypothetical protein
MIRAFMDAFDCLFGMTTGKTDSQEVRCAMRSRLPGEDLFGSSLSEETGKRKKLATRGDSASAGISLRDGWRFARQRFLQLLLLFG